MKFTESTFDGGVGRRCLIASGTVLATIPPDYARWLTEEHKHAFTDPAGYFLDLAAECDLPNMKEWLTSLAQGRQLELEVNLHASYGDAVVTRVGNVNVDLRRPFDVPDACTDLATLYSLISGNWEDGYSYAGGLHLPIGRVAWWPHWLEETWLEPGVDFYTNGCGDSVIAVENNAYWCAHDDGIFQLEGTVADVINRYFAHQQDGTIWESEFYRPEKYDARRLTDGE